MAEFRLSRFKYIWRGDWAGDSGTYFVDDVVLYGGKAWVCIRQHQADVFDDAQTFTNPGDTFPSPAWILMSDGREFYGQWTANTEYIAGVIVIHGGNLWLCTGAHKSQTYFSDNIGNWEVLAAGSNFVGDWQPTNSKYRIGDVVKYNGYVYVCTLEHTSPATEDGISTGNNDGIQDSTAETWNVVLENIEYRGAFSTNTRYRKNDWVKYGGSILRCIEEHTSSGIVGNIDELKFEIEFFGFNYANTWSPTEYYSVGDVVRNGGTLYVATSLNYGHEPGINNEAPEGNPNWAILVQATDFKGAYISGTIYKQGDLVRRGGNLWLALQDVYNNDSTLDYADDSNWQLIIPGQTWRGTWHSDNQVYYFNDVVYYRGSTYLCNTAHTSTSENFPGDNGNGFEYWTLLVQGDSNAALEKLGDLLTYNLNRTAVGDTSSLGPVPVPIPLDINQDPEVDKVLIVEDNEGSLGYDVWGNTERRFYVRTNGVDDVSDPNRGKNYFKPWRTLRYALQQADDGYEFTTKIILGTGEYQEILPLIVPARTAVVGDELRSSTVRANEPISEYAIDAPKMLDALIRISSVLQSIILCVPINKSPGNTADQDTSVPGNNAGYTLADTALTHIIDLINHRVNDIGLDPVITGTNTATDVAGILAGRNILIANKEFLTAEAVAYVNFNFPLYTFDETLYTFNIGQFIDAIAYDMLFPGTYKSNLAARYYANAAVGSQLEDMFYVRDTTGIRNLTLKGLEGTLPALIQGQDYRLPTGGSFVSLDPGWGPDDQRTWVLNRSCYVQNVTTFGTAAIGQKIDGALHNGGNRSIVSNDFTQVISDGIGAWVANGGRAELVSVFTYYCNIGMYATDGGIIRATNGNSSYGRFGAVADGLDPNEFIRFGNLNTRTEQAQVYAAFAGEINDFILALEFENAGENYTNASYEITSSGTGATTQQEEVRDNAVFTVELFGAGSGFNLAGNQAQFGDAISITLATSETALASEIEDMRIILISGPGTGQYAIVDSYNAATKYLTVRRESDGQIGWDHLIPGFPVTELLTTGTRYRIEPRPVFSAPLFNAVSVAAAAGEAWASAVYGETDGTFTNVIGNTGTGQTIDVIPVPAVFTVTKLGRQYSVIITSGGAGYAVGDSIILSGADVGGIDGEHDVRLTVTDVSDDSTNSVLTVIVGGVAINGTFVLLPSSGTFAQYSQDADTWDITPLPTAGNWKASAAGNYKFVAISRGTNNALYSNDGINWFTATMPSSRNWEAVAYGKPSNVSTGVFVAIASNLNAAAFSTNGQTWTSNSLPVFGDSTFNNWVDIAYGNNRFVVIANSGNIAAVGTWNGTTVSWQGAIMDTSADSSPRDWVSVAYGNQRFVAISSTGDVGYSFNGSDWYASPNPLPSPDGSTIHNWTKIKYGQGVFFAIGDTGGKVVSGNPTTGPTTFAATSYDGVVWTERTLADEENWGVLVFGSIDTGLGDSTFANNRPTWIIAPTTTSGVLNKVFAGCRAIGRVYNANGISQITLFEPGSGYVGPPTLTIFDPNKTIDPIFNVRIGDGVLAQPTFVTRGQNYKTSTTIVRVIGDGFADITPNGRFLTVDNLDLVPGPGAQFYIGGRSNFYVAVVVGLDVETLPNGKLRSRFQISPIADYDDYLEHDMEVIIREDYSQVRITGHDFLDVGAGNFEETNYPSLYIDYDFQTDPLSEVATFNGGRVFYTSTDQSGNFRGGEQFAVEQATGIITISADFFDLQGLTELRLAGVQVGSTAIIREFSKDPLFLQNSNNVIPTQRAIVAYLQSRLNVGGEDLLTPSIIAGTVKVGPNEIDNTASLTVDVPVVANFAGNQCQISGTILAQTMFYRSFNLDE